MTETKRSNESILLVDDDPQVLKTLGLLFSEEYKTRCVSSGKEAIDAVREDKTINAIVMDIKMAGMDGVEAGRAIRELNPHLPIIFHTGYPGDYREDEIDANEKPFDYIQKGKSLTRLMRSVKNAVELYAAKTGMISFSDRAEVRFGMIGRSKVMQNVFMAIQKASNSDTKVMILGETGTGKELVARAIHNNSSRREKSLAIFNCNHKNPELVESELFGHVKGAFTDAKRDQIGLFEYANEGTVFLDEIGDLDITTQAKLLRVLETGEYQPIGHPEVITTNVRLVCATHRDLEQLVKEDKFRQDLYYRLKGIVIPLPPLRLHREDIPHLVSSFLEKCTIQKGLQPKVFDSGATNVLMEYDWPGNVRQLLDTVESLVALSDSGLILESDVSTYLSDYEPFPGNKDLRLTDRMKEIERTLILEALTVTNYHISEAARVLGIERATFSKKIKSHGIDITSLKSGN
ncbi:MAG: sigma-54-dependent Fis family transcriptional regulator [candidate division Zixibacteria bacterium]|nr:sigma-54-dependent Fis family transcriptional regulator [candidate division Zixibacteria bacterium]